MRRFKGILLKALLITSIAFLISCNGSPSGSSNNSSLSDGEVSFKLNGTEWVSSGEHPEASFAVDAITDKSTMVRVEAFAKDGSFFAITIYKESGVTTGTYPITDQGMSGFFKYVSEDGDGYVSNGMESNPGSITISSLTEEKVTGTFEFKLRNAANPDEVLDIIEGSFEVSFSYY